MGSGKTISLAGPSVIFVYMIIGFMLFFVMRAMGELLLSNMAYKSFSDFAADLLGPWAGFFTGWTYWFCWIVTGIADVIAISGYFKYWWPGLAAWIPALLTIAALLLLNLPTVRAFGETEFWFALIKIIAIVSLIVVGIVMVVSGFTAPNGATSGIDNLWNDGGMFPTGFMGLRPQASRSPCSPSWVSSSSVRRQPRRRTRRRTCRRPSTPSPFVSCCSTSLH